MHWNKKKKNNNSPIVNEYNYFICNLYMISIFFLHSDNKKISLWSKPHTHTQIYTQINKINLLQNKQTAKYSNQFCHPWCIFTDFRFPLLQQQQQLIWMMRKRNQNLNKIQYILQTNEPKSPLIFCKIDTIEVKFK